MAALVLAAIPAGFVMMSLPSGSAQDTLFDVHRSLGFTIFCLAVVRVAVRTLNPPPPPPASLPALQWRVAETVHYALYGLLLVMPILGWLASSAFGSTVRVYGLFDLPNLVSKDDALADLLGNAHAYLGFVISGLLVVHIGVGLWHGLVRRDGILSRMLPSLSR